jgi:pimeloyl-ACP methyl ester carboxylesterase
MIDSINKHRTAVRLSVLLIALYSIACLVVGIALAEFSLHLHKLPLRATEQHRERIREKFNVEVGDVALTAADGAILKAWFVQPFNPNGKSVIILHGITANRVDSTGFAEIFLNQGYSVLMPDSREHGESGGIIATYGILEKQDVNLWTQWLRQREAGCTYLLGESMGAAIGLQATAISPALCAVAVESPYSTFREISYERLGRATRTGILFWRTLGRPAIEVAIAYSYLKYGIYLPDASPEAAVEHSTIPSLLIAGTADNNIPMHHSQELEAVCSTHCALWIVPNADHGGASTVAHTEFEHRILDWFQSHDTPLHQ